MTIWLPDLAIDRLRRDGRALPEGRPFALYIQSGNVFVLSAADPCARRRGVTPGLALADARAIIPDLVAMEADEAADAKLLHRIAAWCERFTPIVVVDAPDGLFLEVGGSVHLFGDETQLRAEAHQRLAQQGLKARVAIAPTPGAAWAAARFSNDRLITAEDVEAALASLPVRALRIEAEAAALLKRLGLKTVGHLMRAPRQTLAARAGEAALRRLDQALGRASEALSPRRPPPILFASRRLVEPVVTLEAILIGVDVLAQDLCQQLDARGEGARRLLLSLFGVDGKVRSLDLGLTRPERDSKAMLRLLEERLKAAAESFEAEFGFEAMRLEALETAPIQMFATDLAPPAFRRDPDAEARVRDRIAARLGKGAVGALGVVNVHAPERTSGWAVCKPLAVRPPKDGVMRRPLTLFDRAQPVEKVFASVPDGPPARFTWRRVVREIVRAEGPERIAPNWLKAPYSRTRDYYRIEDREGRRYWVYREGDYGDSEAPRWFVHGLFA